MIEPSIPTAYYFRRIDSDEHLLTGPECDEFVLTPVTVDSLT